MKQKDGPWLFPGDAKQMATNETSHMINIEIIYALRLSSDEINFKWLAISESVLCVSVFESLFQLL